MPEVQSTHPIHCLWNGKKKKLEKQESWSRWMANCSCLNTRVGLLTWCAWPQCPSSKVSARSQLRAPFRNFCVLWVKSAWETYLFLVLWDTAVLWLGRADPSLVGQQCRWVLGMWVGAEAGTRLAGIIPARERGDSRPGPWEVWDLLLGKLTTVL